MDATQTTFQKYPAYKDSGVEWLGEIPVGWEIGKLGTLLKPTSVKNRPDLPLLSITREEGVIERNLEDDSENHNFIPDDLSGYKLLKEGQFGMNKMKAWQGSYGIAPITGIVSPAYFVFDFNSSINPRFFHLAIRSKNYVAFFGQASDGVRVGQWDLSKTRMKEIPFFVPPLPEQTAIAAFLDDKTAKIDRAIAQKEKMIALLKERKQIIIQHAVTKGLDPNAKMKDSGVEWIGEVPEGWEVVKFKYLIRTKARLGWKGLKADEYVEHSPYGFLSTPNIKNTDIDFDGAYYISEFRYEESPEIMLEVGDVLLVKDGSTLGISNLVRTLPFKCTVNSSIAVLRIMNKKRLSPAYLNLFLKSETCQHLIEKKKDGMGVPHLFQRDINNFSVPIFGLSEQESIVAHIETQSAKIDRAISLQEQQIGKLKELKATLIDGAVTGKIKVSGL